MDLANLRHTAVYETALRTPNVMGRQPAHLRVSRKHKHLVKDEEIFDAGLRLDHLMRNAIDPAYFPEFPCPRLLSAIKLFLETIDNRARSMALLPQTLKFITPRLDFCREMVRQADAQLVIWELPPVSSDAFRQLIITHENEIEEIIFKNPFHRGGDDGGHLAYFAPVRRRMFNELYTFYWR